MNRVCGELLWTKGNRGESAVCIKEKKSVDYKSLSLSKTSHILPSDDRLSAE